MASTLTRPLSKPGRPTKPPPGRRAIDDLSGRAGAVAAPGTVQNTRALLENELREWARALELVLDAGSNPDVTPGIVHTAASDDAVRGPLRAVSPLRLSGQTDEQELVEPRIVSDDAAVGPSDRR